MNIRFGGGFFGRFLYAGKTNRIGNANDGKGEVRKYYPNQFTVIAYAENGTKTAFFGSGIEKNPLSRVTFDISSTGCGSCELLFKVLPKSSELNYMQRIDIHLFGDEFPWYSGYIITRPVEGTTDTEFKFTAHGYYNRLETLVLFETYENMDPGAIVRDIARKAEKNHGLVYNGIKIADAGYRVTKLVFDGVTAKEALSALSDFAVDFVYGVDEYRSLYFQPREQSINEQARFTVGKHINKYQPSWNTEKIYNWARIKGGSIDDKGEQWLCSVQDNESIAKYGKRDKVLTLPSAYEAKDARRWGENQIAQYKKPVRSAKVSGVRLDYPLVDGTFNVRHLTTMGQAQIRTLDGNTHEYPITKVKYTISATAGISADMTLGEPFFELDRYLSDIERNAKKIEQSQASAIRQLKT